jgi:hypothetical protein
MKVERETQKLSNASMEFCLEVNAEKTKYYMFMSRHQIAGQHNMKASVESFGIVAKMR